MKKRKVVNDTIYTAVENTQEIINTTDAKRLELMQAYTAFEAYKDTAISFIRSKLTESIYKHIKKNTLDDMSLNEKIDTLRKFNKLIAEEEKEQVARDKRNGVVDKNSIRDVYNN